MLFNFGDQPWKHQPLEGNFSILLSILACRTSEALGSKMATNILEPFLTTYFSKMAGNYLKCSKLFQIGLNFSKIVRNLTRLV